MTKYAESVVVEEAFAVVLDDACSGGIQMQEAVTCLDFGIIAHRASCRIYRLQLALTWTPGR